ncbi:unnamed protein product [Leptosia nina]|uniref:Major facilitator superfamily (MFS) profile domain-containing protein n=1 Tax=Leptosia nina TaxID=320188 RepID=A0AAV1JYE6_9NEOP
MTEKEYTKIPTKELEHDPEPNPVLPKYGYGVRHLQAFLAFLTLAFAYLARAHLGVTIVAMTNEIENNTLYNHTEPTIQAVLNNTEVNLESSEWNIYRTYRWPKSTQEIALSSFFMGYFIMTFLSGIICQKWGGKIPLQIAMLVNGVVSILSPWAIAWGDWKALAACRVIQGLSQGGMLPGIHTLLANWVPLSERGSLSSYVYTGSGFGTVIGFQFSGLLAYSRFGWPSTFWAVGLLCLFGFTLFSIFGSATPGDHKTISEEEKNYIIGRSGEGTQTQPSVPWKTILTSKHVLANFVSHIGNVLCFTFYFMQVPTYMFAILKVNIRNSGLLSSLPYIFFMMMSMLSGNISDALINKKVMTTKSVRRLANTIASTIPAISLCLVSYTENVNLALMCFVIALGAQAVMHSGWIRPAREALMDERVNYIDLSPNYSGVLMAVGNGLANLAVLVLPVMVSNIVTDVTNQVQWRITLFIMAGITLLTNIVFVIFISTDVQPWNEVKHEAEDATQKS